MTFTAIRILAGLTFSATAVAASPPSKSSKTTGTKPAIATPVRTVTAMSTSLKSGHPILFLNGETQRVGSAPDLLATRLQFPADQRYSKWSVVFDRPIIVDTLEVETCKGTKPFADGVELFLDYNEKRYFSDGGRSIVKFKPKRAATALTLNFLESQGLCLEAVRIGTKTDWMRSNTLPSVGDFVVADGSFGTFDRRTLDGKKIKLEGTRKPGVWKLQWENPLIVDGLRIWNGNQHPGPAYGDNDRVSDLEVTFDDGEATRFPLQDRRGFHVLKIGTPRAVRSLQLKSMGTFAGGSSGSQREPVLGEVQILAGGETWIPVVAVTAMDADVETESVAAKLARTHGYGDLIDRELRSAEQKDVWRFRFRSDGTFFARVFVDRVRIARAWSVAGTWRITEIVRKSEKDEVTGLTLYLTGSKLATANEEDSLACAEECSAEGRSKFPVEETIEIQKSGSANFFLRNRTAEDKRAIEFTDLKLRLHSLYD